MIILETPRLRVQTWQLSDWPEFKPLAQNPEVMRFIGSGGTWDDARIQTWVQRQLDDQSRDGFCFWQLRLKTDHRLIGFCGLHRLESAGIIEIGWWILPELWGQGLASEVAAAVKEHALTILGIKQISAICHEDNLASERVMQKIGLQYERNLCSSELGLALTVPCKLYSSVRE